MLRSHGPVAQESSRSMAKAAGPHTRLNIVVHKDQGMPKFFHSLTLSFRHVFFNGNIHFLKLEGNVFYQKIIKM